MSAADRPLSGLIVPNSRGTFEPVAEFEPGAVLADFLHVIDGDELIDSVAWEAGRARTWWLRHDIITHVGDHELDDAWWHERPARLLETPAAYVAAHSRGFVILDWSSDVNAIVGRVAAVECATPALYERLRRTLIEQAMPRGLTITTAAKAKLTSDSRRAA